MNSVYTQPLSDSDIQNGVLVYAESTSDIWLFLDTANTVADLDIPFPPEPANDQTFGYTTVKQITNLTHSTSKRVIGSDAGFKAAEGKAAWTYNEVTATWYVTT